MLNGLSSSISGHNPSIADNTLHYETYSIPVDSTIYLRAFRHYKSVTAATAKAFFEDFLGHARHIPHWLISYRDHAYPNEREMRALIAAHRFAPAMRFHDHHYAITSRLGEASHAKERLFICRSGKGKTATADAGASETLHSQAIWEETANEVRYPRLDLRTGESRIT